MNFRDKVAQRQRSDPRSAITVPGVHLQPEPSKGFRFFITVLTASAAGLV